MRKSILALAMGTFALGCSEFGMMSILSAVAADYAISAATAGHFISIYALGVCAGALFFALAGRGKPIKKLLVIMTAFICLGNLAAVLAPNYWAMLAARFISGLPHGAFFGAGGIVAKEITPPKQQDAAVAAMFSGMTLANLIGIPAATFVTHLISWHMLFALIALWALATLFFIARWVPNVKPLKDAGFARQFDFLKKPLPWLLLGTIIMGNGGLFCWYSYINPIMVKTAGFPASAMALIMALAGLGMVLGNYAGGLLSLRFANTTVITAMLGLMCAASLLMLTAGRHQDAALAVMFIGVFGLFGVSSLEQSLIIDIAKGGELLGASSAQVAFNLGNAAGAWLGAYPINAGYGYEYSALPGVALNLCGLALMSAFVVLRQKQLRPQS